MLGKTQQQSSFWGSEWVEHLIDKESFEWHFRRIVRPLIKDEDFAWAYSKGQGRESVPPSLVACALILQQRYRFSDREMERQIRFNLATKYALNLPMDDKGFDHTVLCKFRKMLIENDATRLCFEKFREVLIEAGLIKAGEVAVIDTTHVIADIAIPNTIQLIQMGMKEVLRAAGKALAGVGSQLAKNLELKAVYDTSKRGGTKEQLVELVGEARRLISYLEASGDARHPAMRESVEQLKRILQENTSETSTGKRGKPVLEERSGHVINRLVSTVDTDARHGRKSTEKKFTGYKAQIIVSENEFITAIDGMVGNRHDNYRVEHLVDELSRNKIKPRWLVGDKAYCDEPLGVGLENKGVRMVTPLKDTSEKEYFPNDRFEYIAGQPPRMRCPAGYETDISDYHPWKERYFHFSGCGGCHLKEQCTTAESRSAAASPSYFFRQRKVEFNATSTYKNLMKQRSKVERKNGQLKTNLGFRRCRYRGLPKFIFQCVFSALTANIQKLITIFVNAPPAMGGLAVGTCSC